MGVPTSLWLVKDTTGNVIAGFSIERKLAEWLKELPTNKLVEIIKVRNNEPGAKPVVLNPRTLKPAE